MTTTRAELLQRNAELCGIAAKLRAELADARRQLNNARRREGMVAKLRVELKALRRQLKPASYARRRFDAVTAELQATRKQLSDLRQSHKSAFEQGSRATLISCYLALADYGTLGAQWLSARLSALSNKKLLPSTEFDNRITASVIEGMRKYSPTRADELDRSFQRFLETGDVEGVQP